MRQKYPGFKHKVRETKNKAVVEEDTIGERWKKWPIDYASIPARDILNGMNDEELNKPVVHKILFYLICKYRTHKNVIDWGAEW